MSELFLYDDTVARAFEPFALTRPACELRAGVLLVRERWEHALGVKAAGVIAASHLEGFDEPWGVRTVSGTIPAGSVIANSRFAVALGRQRIDGTAAAGGRTAAVCLARDVDAAELANGATSLESLSQSGAQLVELPGRWLDHLWDFIAHLSPMLTEDIAVLGSDTGRSGTSLGAVSGPHDVFAEDGATVESHVYFDTSAGPVLLRRGCTVHAFTRIAGPCAVGAESIVGGDKVSGSSIGEVCKVHGEVSATIFLGHANKGHDGFVGHSMLGRWANLGAGTITSNMKNTYGTVQLWTPDGARNTGLQFLGTMFGDHVKTGIGTTLSTGTVLGPGANIYGSATPPKAVAPFAWGDGVPYETYRLDKFLDVATRAMERRHVTLSASQRAMLTAAFAARWTPEGAR